MKKIGIILRDDTINNKKYKVISDEIINYINLYDVIIIGIITSDNIEFNKITTLIDLCDGIIMPGGNEYSKNDLKLARYLNEKNKPTLGICLGMQCMSEAINGDIKKLDTLNHYSIDNYVHKINIKKDSKLYSILNNNCIYVNSRHKYYVINTNLSISSYSDDFIIEGVEDFTKKFYIGIQWHPESNIDDINSRLIIEEFIRCC